MKKISIALGVFLSLSVSGIISETSASAASTVPVYRLYNKNTGEHFYTKSAFEKNSLKNSGWNDEGTGWIAATSGTPVYRVYNPNSVGGDHYYTMSKYEAQSLVKSGWRWDNGGNAAFYSGGNVNLYVAYNPNAGSGSHNYTTNSFEQNSLLNGGWKFGAVAWKVQAGGSTVTPPVGRTVYVAGKDSKVYWYSLTALIDYGNKHGHPVNQSEIFTMTESQAISSGRRHSLTEK
ncbi:surface antigen [Lactococcus cremoris]|nr:hypothetical protein [Lactococcus cremoris]EUN33690.1 hypothetical protein LLCHP_1907 [Lactococcus cremoris subsp. cremoris HP]KZK12571.1 prophage pi3 protein 01 [Lactococcus cremoris]KZK35279.1 prophage pi3 protein 01 [Lactococcus cremoris]MCT4464201.1 glycoside hydrolase, family 25 [Lactococcus cremoris]PCS19603.1 surface antigen [Lactococcus cremoris]